MPPTKFFLIRKSSNNKVFCSGIENRSALPHRSPLKFAQKLIFSFRLAGASFRSAFYLRMSGEHGKLWHFLPLSRRGEDELALPMSVELPLSLATAFQVSQKSFVLKLLHSFGLSAALSVVKLYIVPALAGRSFQLMERINPSVSFCSTNSTLESQQICAASLFYVACRSTNKHFSLRLGDDFSCAPTRDD